MLQYKLKVGGAQRSRVECISVILTHRAFLVFHPLEAMRTAALAPTVRQF